MTAYFFFHERISRSSARLQSQICGTLFYHIGKRGRRQLSCLFLHIRDQLFLQGTQFLLGLLCRGCQNHDQVAIREYNTELAVGAVCAGTNPG